MTSRIVIKAWLNMKAVFWQGIMVSTQISRSRFKQSKIYLLNPLSTFWAVLEFLGDFWEYLE